MATTRRTFLKTASVGAVVMADAVSLPAASRLRGLLPNVSDRSVDVWLTDDDQRMTRAPQLLSTENPTAFADSIVIDEKKEFQPILGFGAAFTDGSCLLLSQLSAQAREDLLHRLFHQSEMGMNVCRTCIGSSDHSASIYSFDEGEPDPDLKRFSIDHDRTYILPALREARSVNPDLFLFSSPWSPPGWMKDNNSMLGGCMRHTYMPAYANYFVKFLQSYASEGVPIQAVTVQNEVDADQQGLMPACFWPQDYEVDFVTEHLGPAFERSGLKTQIWIIDHNYNLWGRAIAEFETPGMLKYTQSVAWHGYSGLPEWMMRVQKAFPQVSMHWTEGSPDHDDPDYAKCWVLWSQKFSQILRNGCRSITGWCLATDERGRPNVGPYPLGGLLTIDSKSKDVYHSGQFWAMEHYSRFIQRGAVRIDSQSIDSQSSAKDLAHCAFRNSDGSIVTVITNSGGPRVCEVRLQDGVTGISLTGNSIVTLKYSRGMPA